MEQFYINPNMKDKSEGHKIMSEVYLQNINYPTTVEYMLYEIQWIIYVCMQKNTYQEGPRMSNSGRKRLTPCHQC